VKTALLTGIRQIEVKDIEKPSPGRGEALVKVACVGVCGSDIHYYRTGKIGVQVVKYPFIVGHEASGVVEEVGDGTSSLKPGQRVAIEPAIPCGECQWCQGGRPHICPEVKFLGTPPIDGAYREYMVMPYQNLIPIPDGMSFEEAALTEILAIGLHTVDIIGLKPGNSVAIFGSGPVGLAILLMAKVSGAAEIFSTDLIEARLKMTQKLGAHHLINPQKDDPVEYIKEHTEGIGVDITFEAAGEQETIDHSLDAVKIGGKVAVIGIPELERVSYSPEIRRKELLVQQIRRSNQAARDVERVISLIETQRLQVGPLVTHKFPLEKIKEALDLVDGYKDGVVKAMIDMGGAG